MFLKIYYWFMITLVYFKDIDKKPIHQNMNDMMGSYFDIKNQNRNKHRPLNNDHKLFNRRPSKILTKKNHHHRRNLPNLRKNE